MKKIFLLLGKSLFLLQLILLGFSKNISAQTLYAENFGTTTGGLPTGWTSSNATNGWTRVTTTPSTTYTNASGGANINFVNNGANAVSHTLTYSNNLATTGAYTQVTVTWGARATTGFNQTVTFEWRNGNAGVWTNAPYTQVLSNGNWAFVNSNVRLNLIGALGSTNLQFRFTVTSNNTGTYSIDDFSVAGSSNVNNDCRQVFNTNRLVCGTTTFSDNSNGRGGLDEFDNTIFPNNQRGCLVTGERQSAWYAFRVRTAGTLTFTIVPSLITNDFDWAIWGPFNSMDANFNCQNLGPPVRCNYAGASSPLPITGLTGMNLTATGTTGGAAGSAFNRFLDVLPGQIYILLVDNFSISTTPFTLVWNTATVTASNGNTVGGGNGTATLAAASPGFRTPVSVSCNKATFINQSATCDGTLTYLWDFGDGQPVTATNSVKDPVYYYQAAGTYNVKLTISINSPGSPNNGLTEEFIRQVTIVGSPPTATITNLNSNYCIDSPPITLTGTGNPVNGTPSFVIQPNGSSTGQIDNATQFNPATLGVGTHAVIMQYISPIDPNCVGQTIKLVTVSPKVPPTITGLAATYCPNSPIVNLVGAPTGGSFTVNGTAATQFNPTALGAGTHTVIYTVINATTSCVSSQTQTVTISSVALPTITNLNTSYCVGGSAITLTGTPAGGTFTINGTAATQFNPTTLGVGNHTVVYTAAGCTATATQMVEVKVNPVLTFTGLNTQYCVSAGAFTLQATPTGGTFKVNTIAATQFNPTTLGVGIHTVLYEYTDPTNSSCTNTKSQSVTVLALPTLSFTNLNATYCISASAVTLAATPAGGTFTVNGVVATQFIPSTLGAGTHTVIYSFTDANGCANTKSQTAQVTALPVLTNNVATAYCLSSAVVTMTGTPGGTFTINGTPATQFNPGVLGVGTYTVIQSFTDANGCSNILSKTVSVNVKPTLNFIGLNPIYCINNPSFALQANPTGGTFKINGTAATQFNPTTLGVGIYTIRYDYISPTDPGCFNDISQTVEVKPTPVVTLTSLNNAYCISVPSFALTGTPAGGTFTINGTAATQFNPATLGAGNHSVIYTFTDVNSCVNTATKSVVVNALPVLAFVGLSDSYCNSNATFNLNATPAGGSFTINGNPSTQFNAALLGIGNYTVVYNYTDANSCNNTLSKSVSVVAKPVLNFVSLNTSYCANNPSFALQASPIGGTFKINGTAATQFNPTTLGVGMHTVVYDYVLPADAGCFNSISQMVEVKAIPTIVLTNINNAYCIDVASFTMAATPAGGTFTINGTAATQFNPTTLGAGNQTVVYSFTDINGCTNTATKIVAVNPLPVLAFVSLKDAYCTSSATFNLSATPAGGTFTVNGTAATQFNPTALGVGSYNVVYNYTDANGCSNQISKPVAVQLKPSVAFSNLNLQYCISDVAFALAATPTGGTFTINGNPVTQFNPTTLGAGTYTVKYNYIDPSDAGCFNDVTQIVKVFPLPQIEWQGIIPAYCVSQLTPVNPIAKITYADGTIVNQPQTAFIPAMAGASSQTLSITATDPITGCQRTSTFNYVINALPIVSLVNVPDEYCSQANPLTLQALPVGGQMLIQGVATNILNPILFAVNTNVNIQYTFTSAATGCTNTINKTVRIVENPGFLTLTYNLEVCPQSSTTGYRLEAMTFAEEQALITAGTPPVYQWSNNTTGRFVALRTESDGGTYTVLIKEQSGCPVKKLIFNVVVSCEPELHLPTAFSPNGDGLNDTWEIFGDDLYKLELSVYSRWGEIVFIAYDQKESWDGRRYGLKLPDGIYVWKAKYQNALSPGTWIYKQGSVTIVR